MNTQAPTQTEQPRCYRIIRQFHPSQGRKSRTIRNGLTLAEAQAHCSDPYFDGWDYMKGCAP